MPLPSYAFNSLTDSHIKDRSLDPNFYERLTFNSLTDSHIGNSLQLPYTNSLSIP